MGQLTYKSHSRLNIPNVTDNEARIRKQEFANALDKMQVGFWKGNHYMIPSDIFDMLNKGADLRMNKETFDLVVPPQPAITRTFRVKELV